MSDLLRRQQPSRGIMGYPAINVANPTDAWTQAAATPPAEAILYIHIPFCRSRCSFCPFYSGGGTKEEWHIYVELLRRELLQWSGAFCSTVVNSVYFGGGTPSDLAPEALNVLLDVLHENYNLANDYEITLESRIDGLTDKKMDAALSGGINRFSLGVQTFDTSLRRKLGRVSSRETVLNTLSRLTSRNQASVTADILYGLPGETADMLLADFNTVIHETSLSGISFYRLHIHPQLALSRQIEQKEIPPLPDDHACFELFQLGEKRMAATGANRISFKHFSLHPRERNLHNEISAWKVPCIPFGINAGGRLGQYRLKQVGDLTEYRKMVESGLKPLASAGLLPDDYAVGARIAGQLNCRMSCSPEYSAAAAPKPLQAKLQHVLQQNLQQLVSEGLFEDCAFDSYVLTAAGRFHCAKIAGSLMECAANVWKQEVFHE